MNLEGLLIIGAAVLVGILGIKGTYKNLPPFNSGGPVEDTLPPGLHSLFQQGLMGPDTSAQVFNMIGQLAGSMVNNNGSNSQPTMPQNPPNIQIN